MATNKPSRSDFIIKLHDLLEHPLDPESLRWTGDLTFEITSHDRTARHALSGKWEFNSLSSFIRQLSYYNFKRLSDRRRSNDRRMSQSGYIVFSHPSGFFRRGDNSELNKIVRKSRNRPEKAGARRVSSSSMISNGSYEDDAPPMPSWPQAHNPYAHYGYPDDRRASQQYALGIHHQPSYHTGSPVRHDEDGQWRSPFSAVKWSQDPNDMGRNDARRSSDYRVTLPSPTSRRIELGHGPGRASLSIQTSAAPSDKIVPYPTPTFHSPSFGQHMPLPEQNVIPTGLAGAYHEPMYSTSYSQQPQQRETSLPSPSDSEEHAASGVDSPPWIASKLAPIHTNGNNDERNSLAHAQNKPSVVSPRQSYFSNSNPTPQSNNGSWGYPLPSPTENKVYDYQHDAVRRPEYFEGQRDSYRV